MNIDPVRLRHRRPQSAGPVNSPSCSPSANLERETKKGRGCGAMKLS